MVSGADITSEAILDATIEALKAAGATDEDIEELKAAPGPVIPKHQDEVRTVDVVVCGGGAGGLAAAIEAKHGGADVVLIEKQGVTGGYARNKEMIARYPVAHCVCNAPKSNIGEGLIAAEAIGTALFYGRIAGRMVSGGKLF